MQLPPFQKDFHSNVSLLDKLSKIEALIQGTSSEGERQAALFAKERLFSTLAPLSRKASPEFKICFDSLWKKRLFVAVSAKHGLSTYRYYRQKHTTTCLGVEKGFMHQVLCPEYQKYRALLEELVKDLTSKIYKLKEKIVTS